jgi:hypothetical protein
MQRYFVFPVIIILVVSVVAIIALTSRPNTPQVGAFLYLWYGSAGSSGLGTPGWNSSSYPGGGAVVDTPVIGYYSSDANQTFAWQVSQMQKAGLSFAILSWWGPFTENESGVINKAAHDFFAYLKSTSSSFKASIMIDAYNGTRGLSNSSLMSDYDYIYENFVEPFGNWYFAWEGKPLLLTFNPVQPLYDDSRFTSKMVGNHACEPISTCPVHDLNQKLDWIFWNAPSQYFEGQGGTYNATNDEGTPVTSADGEVTIVPRIDSYFDREYEGGSYLRFDTHLEGLYAEQWTYVFAHCSQVKLVLIYSWNEYHERTAIEPHMDHTVDVSSTYLSNTTSHYVSELC